MPPKTRQDRGAGTEEQGGMEQEPASSTELQEPAAVGRGDAVTSPAVGPTEGIVSELAGLVKVLLQSQVARDDRMEQVMAKQDQRWRNMQHQFQQIQHQVGEIQAGGDQRARQAVSTAASPVPTEEGTSFGTIEPRLNPLTREDDIEQFLTTFERMATACRWPQANWPIRLVPLLTGKARGAYVAMDGNDAEDYDKVKEAILIKYEINAEIYRQRFRSVEIRPDENPRELYCGLRSVLQPQQKKQPSSQIHTWLPAGRPSTALEVEVEVIIAAQAGYVFISNYLLNYFPGMDIEERNCHGFTALMKATMQGQAECVRALMLAGGDIQARDNGRSLTPRDWALFTGRYETAHLMHRLMSKPCAEQFCDSFSLEWPPLEELVAQAQEPKSYRRHLINVLSCCSYRIYINNKVNPVDEGVLDHMVQLTTALSSPAIATACHTVCPGSPPCIGKRRPAVQEILRRQRVSELKRLGPDRLNNYKNFFQNSRVLLIPKARDRRASLQTQLLSDVAAVAMRRASLLPLNMLRRSSVRPGIVVPKVRLCKDLAPSFVPEKLKQSGYHNDLQIPKWNYKMKRRGDECYL
ncbi:ankyrin repeat domain-containing protein 33B-like [Pungitius pungitius]|uniref:ankyrin repeat domain-containing protein 33B-like n=1 Tax=Pungitius pungitius TaxID=134920 RepID=UPI002E0F72EB